VKVKFDREQNEAPGGTQKNLSIEQFDNLKIAANGRLATGKPAAALT
jgi:hypothetical protein